MTTPEKLALAAASQATFASSNLLQIASDGFEGNFVEDETIQLLADALKMTIEIARDAGQIESDEYGADVVHLHAFIAKFLQGWAG